MSYFAQHPRARWAVPVVALATISAAAFVTSRAASADAGLPTRTAAQLLSDVHDANLESLSGTVVQTADLGLPQLPGLSGGGSSDVSLMSLASGSHTWRVWFAGPTQQRLALVGSLGESDIIRNGSDLWLWSSQDKSAVHHTLTGADAKKAAAPLRGSLPGAGNAPGIGSTPADAAQSALAVLGASTKVTTSGTAVVAGRSAYELVLAPKTSGSRIAQIRIAIDAAAHIPLRVQVFSTKLSNPAFEVGFTAVDFAKPDARQFAFNPPPGTTVTQADSLLSLLGKDKHNAAPSTKAPSTTPTSPAPAPAAKPATPKIVGSGWSTVVVTSVAAPTAGSSASGQTGAAGQLGQLSGILKSVPRATGSWGSGHVIDGTLFSAVLTDDGRVAVGAVAPDALYAALAAK